MTSCESFLDKEEDSNVSETVAFANFNNFQGYVEQIYGKIPNKSGCNWCPSWNWGDDEIFNPEGDSRMTHKVDLGDFWAWNSSICWLQKNYDSQNALFSQGLYNNMWNAIRLANMGIENIEKIQNGELNYAGTAEELNFLKGQMLFFRAWWHFEFASYVGGLPYITKSLDLTDNLLLDRLSFQELCENCAKDFAAAADLLPINWDDTKTGTPTVTNNDLRINKVMALSYQGKALLYAASPLAEYAKDHNGEGVTGAQGSGLTYAYNQDLAKQAAEALGAVLKLVEGGETQYKLAKFEYDDIYEHTKDGSVGEFTSIFYTLKSNKVPGANEAIFRGPVLSADFNYNNWNHSKVWGPKNEKLVEHDNVIHQPTANYVDYAYGMQNGEPAWILQPSGELVPNTEAGFDPKHPFLNRDPRFYHDIVFDGFKYVNKDMDKDAEYLRYCSLYTGGPMRDVAIASRTGYFIQKFVPHTCNKFDREYDWGSSYFFYLPYMRLADVYLMYAEAAAVAGNGASGSFACDLSAVDAVNKIRERCGAGLVSDKYTSDAHAFMDEVRRERAVELCFEGFRFCDLQRWLLLTEPAYTTKYSAEFTRTPDFQDIAEKYKKDAKFDPRNIEVVGYQHKPILTREFTAKHYWFPLPINQTYFSDGFGQNPGW